MQKYYEIPNPLTVEWLTENADKATLSSREMEIALAEHISIDKDFNMEVYKFFAENYPDTLKNTMKLAFKPKAQPHYQALLNLVKEKPEFSDFYEAYCSVKEKFDLKAKAVEDTWQKVKGVRFEQAVVAVNILYLKLFLPKHDYMFIDNEILSAREFFLEAANIYLNRVKEHWKPIDRNLWNDDSKLFEKVDSYFWNLLKDYELQKKIKEHVFAIFNLRVFNYDACEPFIFNREHYDSVDDFCCDAKNQMLFTYYLARNKDASADLSKEAIGVSENPYFIYSCIFMEYFGIKDQFSRNNQTYNLFEFIKDKEIFDTCYTGGFLAEAVKLYEELAADDVSIQEIIAEIGSLVHVDIFSGLVCDLEFSDAHFDLMSTDISDGKSQIDLNLCNMFHYGQSDAFIVSPCIGTSRITGYIPLLNLFRDSENDNSIDETVLRMIKNFPTFKDAKITTSKETGIAVCKDKTLILIVTLSTCGTLTFEEKLKLEKHLIQAGNQLNKTLDALQANAELLAEITGSDNVKFDELKIETMIVSDAFEFDGKKFQGHRKISLLELMAILRDDAYNLIVFSPGFMELYEEGQNREAELKSFILYNTGNPSVEDFLSSLNSNIWERVLRYWENQE
jgi:hypothetical protein